jgi:hypothetical protein
MGLSDELKIIISGDPSKFNKAMDAALESTKKLEAGLSVTAKASGVAFAALTGTVIGLTAAFRGQEVQEQKTVALLKNQGDAAAVTADEVFNLASSLQQVTLFGDEVVMEAENMLLGLTKLSKDGFERATKASLDLATFMETDAKSAAQQLGKALADPAEGLSALGRAGIKFTEDQKKMIAGLAETGQKAAAQDMILKALEERLGGTAAAAAQGTGKFIQLENSLGDIAEELGRALAPALSDAAAAAIPVIDAIANNEELIKTGAAVLGIGVAVTGSVAAFAAAALGILKWNAVMQAANLSALRLSFSIKGLAAATGIGLLIVIVTDLAMNWEKRMAQMSAAWTAFYNLMSASGPALSDILVGMLTGDVEKIGKGLEQLSALGTTFAEDYTAGMKSYYDQQAKDLADSEVKKQEIKKESDAVVIEQNALFLESLKAQNDAHRKAEQEAAYTDGQVKLLMEKENQTQLMQSQNELRKLKAEEQLTDQEIEKQQQADFDLQMQEIKNEGREADLNADRAYKLELAQNNLKEKKQFLMEEKKHGKVMATLMATMRSDEMQGVKSASQDLMQLQNSNNKTLKGIGKAAAIADITIKTAQSAMNIYNGFSTIPIIGPALGIAGAAAAIAYGAEQIGKVKGAKKGGIMTGGIRGVDSIPAMLTPGELVAPEKNFDEVVNAVANQRLQQQGFGGPGGDMHLTIGFTDNAVEILEKKLYERQRNGTASVRLF